MSSAIPLIEHNEVNPNNVVNFKALDAHIAFVQAKIFLDIEDRVDNGPVFLPPPQRKPGRVPQKTTPSKSKQPYRIGNIDVESDAKRYYWFGRIEIGTPGRHFSVVFDTGSSDLFLPSATCGESCAGHNLWDPSSSSTSKHLGKPPFRLNFGGGGSVEGELFTDIVSIAGYTATAQTLGAALKYSTHLGSETFPPDGLLGMAFEEKSKFEARPLIQTLHTQGQITEPAFSIKLVSPGGELFIGGANSERYTGEFTYIPVQSIRSWKVTLENIQVNGEIVLRNIDCIIDTGTALVLGNLDQIGILYDKTGGHPVDNLHQDHRYYSFPRDSFPNISFTFGGTTFPIPPSVLNVGRISEDESSEYLSGIVGHAYINALGQPNWLIGAVFLQSVYTKFDLGVEGKRKPQIGFAKLA